MRWLWFAGPAVVFLVFLFTGLWRTPRQERRLEELQRWLDEYLGPLRTRGQKGGDRRVGMLPAAFRDLAEAAGGGSSLANIVLRPKVAYVALRSADAVNASDYQTVVAQLARPAPSFTARPLPEVDGQPIENTGIQFRKDPAFMDYFLVEADQPGKNAKAIGKWLDSSMRDALLDMPNAWLRVDGNMMALTLYGDADAEKLDELLALADTLYEPHGKRRKLKRGGSEVVSLFPDGEPAGAKRARKSTKTVDAPGMKRVMAGAVDMMLYAVASVLIAMALGRFAWFHSDVFFNNPQMTVREPWQGGWTTKGFGLMVLAESLLVGLFAAQSWLAAEHGQSIGKAVFGLKIVRLDGEPLDWVTALARRTWIYALVPFVVAAAQASPIVPRTIFRNMATVPGAISVAVAVALAAGPLLAGQPALHDRSSGTKVIEVEPFRFDPRQSRLLLVAGGGALAIGALAAAYYASGVNIALFG